VRARINVLSDMPSVWGSRVERWAEFNAGCKSEVDGKLAPERNEEYYLYQTLVGAAPFNLEELGEFKERVKAHMVKAVREAEVNSSWLEPDVEYEEALALFVEDILTPSTHNRFLKDFIPFQRMVAHYGLFNSLSQTLLKITSPGIPDLYQGSELWDFNLADPDNRRPVDFQRRMRLLEETVKTMSAGKLRELLDTFKDGRVKLYVIYVALRARRGRGALFREGEYIPLKVEGRQRGHTLAFCRRLSEEWAMVVVPIRLRGMIKVGEWPLSRAVWGDTRIGVPEDAPSLWRDVLTDREVYVNSAYRYVHVGDMLADFPVALLLGRVSDE